VNSQHGPPIRQHGLADAVADNVALAAAAWLDLAHWLANADSPASAANAALADGNPRCSSDFADGSARTSVRNP